MGSESTAMDCDFIVRLLGWETYCWQVIPLWGWVLVCLCACVTLDGTVEDMDK